MPPKKRGRRGRGKKSISVAVKSDIPENVSTDTIPCDSPAKEKPEPVNVPEEVAGKTEQVSTAKEQVAGNTLDEPDKNVRVASKKDEGPDKNVEEVAETEEETKVTETKEETKVAETKGETKVAETKEETKIAEIEEEPKVAETKEETKVAETKEETKVAETEGNVVEVQEAVSASELSFGVNVEAKEPATGTSEGAEIINEDFSEDSSKNIGEGESEGTAIVKDIVDNLMKIAWRRIKFQTAGGCTDTASPKILDLSDSKVYENEVRLNLISRALLRKERICNDRKKTMYVFPVTIEDMASSDSLINEAIRASCSYSFTADDSFKAHNGVGVLKLIFLTMTKRNDLFTRVTLWANDKQGGKVTSPVDSSSTKKFTNESIKSLDEYTDSDDDLQCVVYVKNLPVNFSEDQLDHLIADSCNISFGHSEEKIQRDYAVMTFRTEEKARNVANDNRTLMLADGTQLLVVHYGSNAVPPKTLKALPDDSRLKVIGNIARLKREYHQYCNNKSDNIDFHTVENNIFRTEYTLLRLINDARLREEEGLVPMPIDKILNQYRGAKPLLGINPYQEHFQGHDSSPNQHYRNVNQNNRGGGNFQRGRYQQQLQRGGFRGNMGPSYQNYNHGYNPQQNQNWNASSYGDWQSNDNRRRTASGNSDWGAKRGRY